MKNISLFQLLGSFFIKFLFCPFISAHYNTLFGKSNQSYCDKNIFICVFYIKQYFYYVFIFFQLFFILFSDFCNADSSYVSYNVFLRWHVIIHEITVIFLLITCHTAFFSLTRIGSDITRLSSINYLWHNVFVLRHVIVAQIAIIYCSKKFGNIIYIFISEMKRLFQYTKSSDCKKDCRKWFTLSINCVIFRQSFFILLLLFLQAFSKYLLYFFFIKFLVATCHYECSFYKIRYHFFCCSKVC